jgi:hypothetical protein
LKLLQEIIRKTFEDIGISNYFPNRTPIAQELRARIDKQYCIKFKTFCTSKKNDNPQHGRKYSPAIQQIKD